MTHHDDPLPTPPFHRWSREARLEWRRNHAHLIPARLRRIPGIVHEPHDMLRALGIVVIGAGSIAGFVGLLLDMTR